MEAPDHLANPDRAFDVARASLYDHDVFTPFRVTQYEKMRDALARGVLRPQTPVLVTELTIQPVALLTTQMAYHHVAQGEIAGHPWLVSF
jgi:hypothetical protein